jgi:hypothetical protein
VEEKLCNNSSLTLFPPFQQEGRLKNSYISLFRAFIGVAVAAGFGGCTGPAWYNPSQTLYGPIPILGKPSIETINLTELMSFGSPPTKPIEDWDSAFDFFERQSKTLSDGEKKRLRNQVQDRIVAASNQRCGEYKNFLKRFDSETNTILGGLATAIGGAGAIFKAADTARALSGVAAIFSGWRAEVNADFFNNLTIQVISKGIEARRKEIYDQIQTDRKDANLTAYSVQRAVGDAAVYHYNCSLIAGLEQAGQSIDRVESPGLTNINKTLDNLIETQKKVATLIPKSPEKSDTPPKAPEEKDTPAGPPENKDTPAKP